MTSTRSLALSALCALALLAPAAPASPQQAPGAGKRSHPGLYFRAGAELDALKAKLRTPPFEERWRRLLANADHFVGQPLTGGSLTRGQDMSRPALGIIAVTAFAYAITADRKYADRAKREAFNLLAEEKWYTDRGWNKGAELATAEASVACALCYDWCFDAFTPAERRDFVERLLDRSTRPYLDSIERHRDWWVDNDVTNWCGVCHGGCGLAALALHDDAPEARKAYDHARRHVPAFLDRVVGEDGGGHEGVMYWRYGVEFGCYFATAAQHVFPGKDIEGLFRNFNDRLAGYWDAAMQGPDGRYANFNDMREETLAGLYGADPRAYEGGPSGPLQALFESLLGAPAGPPRAGSPPGDRLSLWAADNGGCAFYFRGTSPFWFLWRRATPPAGGKPDLPDAMLFRDCGHAVWKSTDLWLAYNGGWVSDRSHCNFDLGTFVLVYRGERFVADPGYGRTATAEHSTLGIDGRDQPKGARAAYLGWAAGNGYRYLISDLTGCYGEDLLRFHRQLVLVDGRILVVVDDVVMENRADLDWRLQSRFEIAVDGGVATLRGKDSVLHVVSAAPRGAVVGVGRATLNYLSIRPGEAQPAQVFVTVLYPGPAGTRPPQVELRDRGADAVLSIRGSNGDSTLEFRRGASWLLTRVGSETVAPPSPPRERGFARVR